MTPRLRFLGSKRWAKAVDAPERHRVGLVIQLPALGEVRRLILEVLRREERGRALAGGRCENWSVGQNEPAAVEKVAHGIDDLVPDPENRLLPLRPDPEVTTVEQILDAVFLRGDRVVLRFTHDAQARHVDLVAAGGPRVRPGGPFEDQRGLLT